MSDTRMGNERLRVGIILGGMSSEREVSLESGRNIYAKINRKKYEPIPIFLDSRGRFWEIPLKLLMRNSTRDVEEDLQADAVRLSYESLAERCELVFIALHGKYGEDGCLQGLLELLGLPYTGSGVLASALGMDKHMCRQLLAVNGIDVPKTVPVSLAQWQSPQRSELLRAIVAKLGLPCVVKPSREGCSTAVRKVNATEAIEEALEGALQWANVALVEEFIGGTEVTCGVLAGEGEGATPFALTPSETIPTTDVLSLEDKFLYGQGENKTPARLPEEILARIRQTALATFQCLCLVGYARIDMFVRDGGLVTVLEANTLPGMTPSTVLFHQAAAAGITQTELIDRIIQAARAAHAGKRGPL